MSNKARNISGKFTAKSETPRKIRSVNLTDDAWQWLADVATKAGVSRNDYLEAMAEGSPLMETVNSKVLPLIETVESDNAQIAEHPDNSVLPLIETAQSELDKARADYAALLDSSSHIKADREKQIAELRSQLAAQEARCDELGEDYEGLDEKYKELDEKYDEAVEWWKQEETKVAGRDAEIAELRSELADLKQNSVTASQHLEKTLPDAGTILSHLRRKNKKTPVTLADIETILGMIEES